MRSSRSGQKLIFYFANKAEKLAYLLAQIITLVLTGYTQKKLRTRISNERIQYVWYIENTDYFSPPFKRIIKKKENTDYFSAPFKNIKKKTQITSVPPSRK